jgi:hypothetical protein
LRFDVLLYEKNILAAYSAPSVYPITGERPHFFHASRPYDICCLYLLNTSNLIYTRATFTIFIASTTIEDKGNIMADESSWIGKEIDNYQLL